jgi:hypothetical protein
MNTESFRGLTEGDFQNNDGLVLGANLGAPIPYLRNYGVGVQLGGSVGLYDPDGRSSAPDLTGRGGSSFEQQYFLTAGIFRRATEKMPFNLGIAHDWMLTQDYGIYAQSPTLGQWRAQSGYCLNACNEFGCWVTVHDHTANTTVDLLASGPTLDSFRSINQGDLFWHHNFENGADGYLWLGFPEKHRLDGDGSLGSFIVGASVEVPLTQRVAITGDVQYMRPSANAGPDASVENAYSVTIGITFYPHSNAQNNSVAGKCWMPYLPVANNRNFLVDTTLVQ